MFKFLALCWPAVSFYISFIGNKFIIKEAELFQPIKEDGWLLNLLIPKSNQRIWGSPFQYLFIFGGKAMKSGFALFIKYFKY